MLSPDFDFRRNNKAALNKQMYQMARDHADKTSLKIDLHCHDQESRVPDELWGRILKLPETWLNTKDLIKCLKRNHVQAFTITNHNNATSCWKLLEKGMDMLSGAEFTCTFPDETVSVHVLTYGFTPEQENKLFNLRKNIYHFLSYTATNEIPTVLAHPLYHYKRIGPLETSIFEKFALLFNHFEVFNGQRDTWQNLLTMTWIKQLTQEKLESWSKKHGINPFDFQKYPFQKKMTGGSDDHFGLFAGNCGTSFILPDHVGYSPGDPTAKFILQGLRDGWDIIPYGTPMEEEKLSVALLDYFYQVAFHVKDPGLLRMFLHRGTLQDKLACLAIANGMLEIKRHKTTLRVLSAFHDSLQGKRPGLLMNWSVSREFRPILVELETIARGRKQGNDIFLSILQETIPKIFTMLGKLLSKRIETRIQTRQKELIPVPEPQENWVEKFEVPSHLRKLFVDQGDNSRKDMTQINIAETLDQLSFPAIVSLVVGGSSFAASRILYSKRKFLNEFANELNQHQHPKRILWMTDVYEGKHGVATVMQLLHTEISKRNLPIDIFLCNPDVQPQSHLKVLPPVFSFTSRKYGFQKFHLPDVMQLQKLFRDGGYDRVICSTELCMGPFALFLKEAFNIPAYFYMHTDWLEYFKKTTRMEGTALDRMRRLLRAFYRRFDGLFVLNEDHRHWLTGSQMGLPARKVFKTAHWVSDHYRPRPSMRSLLYPEANGQDRVLLYSGRLSLEKGVLDLIPIYENLRKQIKHLRLIIAGTGPAEAELKSKLPNAVFLGWVENTQMPYIYSSADILVLPSKFDTFGCVVLEAMRCGLPVAAYAVKGPCEIIEHEQNGFLANDLERLTHYLKTFFRDSRMARHMSQSALKRSQAFEPESILQQMFIHIGMGNAVTPETMDEHVSGHSPHFLWEVLELVSAQ